MKIIITSFAFLLAPFIAFAAPLPMTNPALLTPLGLVIIRILNILDLVTVIVGALTLIWFFWGIIQYVLKGDNVEKREQSRDFMIYAVIAFFVMFSIWGLVHIIQNTFFYGVGVRMDLLPGEIPKVPLLPTS